MSPYPAQVDRDKIASKARELIEAEGIEQLSLAKLAAELGIKAPSLYRHVASKAELLKVVNVLTNQELVAALAQADDPQADPRQRLRAIARAYREFAHRFPVTYGLAYSTTAPESRPDANLLEALALPIQDIWAAVFSPELSLTALRGAFALLHGYVSLELNGQFQRGGDLSNTFDQIIDAYITGWENVTSR
jgi:AcrR family transcriptional regulator